MKEKDPNEKPTMPILDPKIPLPCEEGLNVSGKESSDDEKKPLMPILDPDIPLPCEEGLH